MESESGTPGGLAAEYGQAVQRCAQAQEELEEARRRLNRIGVYPSPPTQPRYRLPDERAGNTCKFEIGMGEEGLEGYFICNEYTDGRPGELFVVVDKEGSFVSGLLDIFATLVSIALQSGVPLESITSKFRHTRFGPAGMTKHPKIKIASSVTDFIMHWLELRYVKKPEET